MNGDFRFDLVEVLKNIDSAEVLSIYFLMLQKTLIVDYRCDDQEGPMIGLMPMVSSIEERYKSVRRVRPHFERPESITMIPWPRRIKSLVDSGVWDKIVRRFVDLGYPQLVSESEQVMDELVKAEKDEIVAAVRGDGYHTLWQKGGIGDSL